MYIKVPADITDDPKVAKWYEGESKGWGYLPNYVEAFALRPDVAAAWGGLNGAIRANMDRRRYELATIAAARAYRSTYCTAAHTKFLRDDCDDEATMRSIAADPTGAELDEVDRAVTRFAAKVAEDAASIRPADVESLRAAGLGEADIVDVALAAAARAFFTKVLDALGVQADVQLGATFDADVREQVTVGRPIADG